MAIPKTTVFNQAQMQLLDMMSFVKSEKALDDLRQVISDFFAQEAQEEINRLWQTGELSKDKVEGFKTLHERTPYND